jgi:hypothetical protein
MSRAADWGTRQSLGSGEISRPDSVFSRRSAENEKE